MKYLFTHWEKIEKNLGCKNILLFLDYDGTLSPIVENPEKAFLPEKTKELLKQLSRTKQIKLAVVSGRSLKDVKKKVGINKIIYAGNHGFEISGTKSKPPIADIGEYLKTLKKLKIELKKNLLQYKGVVIEDKGMSITFHYRMIKNNDSGNAIKAFRNLTKKYIENNEIKIRPGKKVLEIRPPLDWDKGTIVTFILEEAKRENDSKKWFPVYIGDDKTDEDAFSVLTKKGMCIRVGKSIKSLAHYYLKDSSETAKLLQMFLNLKKAETDGRT